MNADGAVCGSALNATEGLPLDERTSHVCRSIPAHPRIPRCPRGHPVEPDHRQVVRLVGHAPVEPTLLDDDLSSAIGTETLVATIWY